MKKKTLIDLVNEASKAENTINLENVEDPNVEDIENIEDATEDELYQIQSEIDEDLREIDAKISASFKRNYSSYTNDSVRQYYNDISGFKALTDAEEKKYFAEYEKTKNPTIREFLINSNLKLVLHNAFKVAPTVPQYKVDILDLVQAGNMGLMRAIEKFEVEKGFKFSTYATWWIRQGMIRHIENNGETIKIPTHILNKAKNISRFETSFEVRTGRAPTIEEYVNAIKLPYEEIKFIKNLPTDLDSLDRAISQEDEEALVNFIPDSIDIATDVENKIYYGKFLEEIKNVLDERQYFIFLSRMGIQIDGIGNEDPQTLEEIGKTLGLTRERIRQIFDASVAKIKLYYKIETTEKSFSPNTTYQESLKISYLRDLRILVGKFLKKTGNFEELTSVLDDTEMYVVLSRLGIELDKFIPCDIKSSTKISKELNIPREKVNIIEQAALTKVKKHCIDKKKKD